LGNQEPLGGARKKLQLNLKMLILAFSQYSAEGPLVLKQILRWLCPHRFSWPHANMQGQDYQVCLLCGTAFEYDVNEMRRTGRLVLPTMGR
jgi:hypothetical protein